MALKDCNLTRKDLAPFSGRIIDVRTIIITFIAPLVKANSLGFNVIVHRFLAPS
jgi:hypothetical protein